MEMQQLADIVWVFLAACLVMFMQPGFAMVETGFTRAKNAGNIIMKNFVDFMVGSVLFLCVGFAVMFGGDGAIIGTAGFFNPTALSLDQFDAVTPELFIFFQTVFCATAATIVSGAVAGRTKFTAYCICSAFVSLIIYPVSGHWIWGGGWLAQMGFIDFAGSTAVHSVGGWVALMGAIMVGPRIGKYNKDGSANAIPGHSLTLGALGVFILWFAWFGFNCGSTLAVNGDIGHIAMTTNLAACVGGLTVMFFTWLRYGKPDVSMTLNGVLAGLVGITAGCQVITLWGALWHHRLSPGSFYRRKAQNRRSCGRHQRPRRLRRYGYSAGWPFSQLRTRHRGRCHRIALRRRLHPAGCSASGDYLSGRLDSFNLWGNVLHH